MSEPLEMYVTHSEKNLNYKNIQRNDILEQFSLNFYPLIGKMFSFLYSKNFCLAYTCMRCYPSILEMVHCLWEILARIDQHWV